MFTTQPTYSVFKISLQFFVVKLCVKEILGQPRSNNFTFPSLNLENSTSCEEFLINTTFDRSKVIDIDWKIFYFWNFEKENTYHIKFSAPSRLLTDRFRVELDKELVPPVNWTEAELFMETSIDFSALFIRTKTAGLFRLIPSLAFKIKSPPMLTFALKYIEPGYLGILNCRYRLCYALAPIDNMPKPEDIKLKADRIGFHGVEGRSYLIQGGPQPARAPIMSDDAEDDEDIEIAERGYIGNYNDADTGDEDDDNDDL